MAGVSAVDPWAGVDVRYLTDTERLLLIQDRLEALRGHLDSRCMVLTEDERDLILLARAEQAKRDARGPNDDMEEPAAPLPRAGGTL